MNRKIISTNPFDLIITGRAQRITHAELGEGILLPTRDSRSVFVPCIAVDETGILLGEHETYLENRALNLTASELADIYPSVMRVIAERDTEIASLVRYAEQENTLLSAQDIERTKDRLITSMKSGNLGRKSIFILSQLMPLGLAATVVEVNIPRILSRIQEQDMPGDSILRALCRMFGIPVHRRSDAAVSPASKRKVIGAMEGSVAPSLCRRLTLFTVSWMIHLGLDVRPGDLTIAN